MMCEKSEYHDDEFCPGRLDCMKDRMDKASRVGIPGLQAFERLPELLRRPIDVNDLPLSKWMRQEGLLHDVRYACILVWMLVRLLTRVGF